jgi:hypothetical protein
MTTWATIPDVVTHLYSPIGLRLVDDLTGAAPTGSVQAALDILNAYGSWQQTDIQAVWTLSGILAYPGLERHADTAKLQPRQYRIRLTAAVYLPLYRAGPGAQSAGIEFFADPYSETSPPAHIIGVAIDTFLLPAPNYPFPTNVPVVRGLVVDAKDQPVSDVLVEQANKERALSDAHGCFALPLRWAQQGVAIAIDAIDQHTGRHGSIRIQLPDDLGQSQKITIS